jgi:uncharacterized membrane protein YagU involved in acid resistance
MHIQWEKKRMYNAPAIDIAPEHEMMAIRHEPDIAPLLRGGIAGFIATAPMTIAMELIFRLLPRHEQYDLPPGENVTTIFKQKLGWYEMNRTQYRVITAIGHFSYGALAGTVYGAIAHRLRLPPLLKGMLYAMAVWSFSYLGWLPAAKVLRPATEHPPRRTALMIISHLVWGAVVGLITR